MEDVLGRTTAKDPTCGGSRRFSAIPPFAHSLWLGLPGHVVQHISLIDYHCIPCAGSGRWLPGGVEYLDDAFGKLNGSSSLGLRQSRNFVVVRPVPQPPQR